MQPIRFVMGFFLYIINVIIISLIYSIWDIRIDPGLYFGFLLLAPIWSFTIYESFASCLGYGLFLYLLALVLWPQTGPFSFSGVTVFTLLFVGVSLSFFILNAFLEAVAIVIGFGACDLEDEDNFIFS